MGKKRKRQYRASTAAVPPGAPRPSMTMWWDPGGTRPPVSWVPSTGEFTTHYDWNLLSAMAVPGYWRGRMTITQAVGGMPLAAWRDVERVDPTPPVLRQPNPAEDRVATVAAWVGDLLDHGNGVGKYIYDRPDDPARRRVVGVMPWAATDTVIANDEDGDRWYVHYVDGKPADTVNARFMFHAKGVMPYPDAPRGLGILEAGLSTLSRARDEAAYAAQAFGSGVPAGLLRVKDPDLQPGSPDDPPGYATAHGLKKSWKQNVAAGDIAVLSDLVDFTPLAWTPTDAQMVEARQLSLVDVANMFNIDPYWVGSAQTSAPYQNVQDAAVQLVRFTLAPWINALEAQFSATLPAGTEARFNRDTLLREQRAERVATEIAMLQAGLTTPAEVRQWEGLPPLQDTPDTTTADATVTPLFPAESDSATNQPATGTE